MSKYVLLLVEHHGHEGDWGPEQICPDMSPVTQFRTKAGNDEVGLSALEARCGRGGSLIRGWDREPSRGEWAAGFQECQGGYDKFGVDYTPFQVKKDTVINLNIDWGHNSQYTGLCRVLQTRCNFLFINCS